MVVSFSPHPAFAICNARTRSIGYIIAAALKALKRTGPADRMNGVNDDFLLFAFGYVYVCVHVCVHACMYVCMDG